MNRSTRIDYAAVNARGVILRTFNDAAKGRAWVRENAALHADLHLQELTTVQIARRIYRPAPAAIRRHDLSFPHEVALCA
ncbi:hypothetical protein [Brevundimonas sp. LjRoot202]|uniref:hypothetical protein n=1 Tax=Brevundimonas sp. LjRoot202 TaxID=3342281 RepID=UPI003ECF399B